MAKKRVKYGFGSPEKYAAIEKKDQNTVYFIYETVIGDNGKEVPGKYGTIYKGDTRLGSAKASDIVFDKELTIETIHGDTPETSTFYTILPGTSLAKFADDVFKAFTDKTQESGGILYAVLDKEMNDENGSINKFVSKKVKDEVSNYVGRLNELAGLLDDETIDKLVKAADDISKVLDDYYTKSQADDLLKEVYTFDSSTEFPKTGDGRKLYVEAETNTVYRWGKDDPDEKEEYYLEISGSGSGGSANVTVETNIYIKDGKSLATIAKNSDYTIEYAFSSANTYTTYNSRKGFTTVKEQIGSTGTVKYYLDGVQFAAGECKAHNYDEKDDSKNVYNTFKIPAAKFTGTQHILKIIATDVKGNSAETSITINIVNVTITSSYAAEPASLNNLLEVPVTVSSSNSVDIFYKVDNEDVIKGATVKEGFGTIILNVSNHINSDNKDKLRTHGVHTLSIWASTYITESDTTITTNPIDFTVIWYDPKSILPIISFECTDEKDLDGNYTATQYEYATFKYQVYPASKIELIVKDLNAGTEEVVNALNVETGVRTWTYVFDTAGKYEMYAKAYYSNNTKFVESDKFTINVKESTQQMDATPDAILFMTAKNHDNAGSHEWKATIGVDDDKNPIEAKLDNFAWNDISGWHTENATTSLRVAGGAHATIPFAMFKKNYASTGMTIEFDFSTSNLSDSTTNVITCYSEKEKRGIIITATGAYWETGEWNKTDTSDTRITIPFKENERTRISFVMTPQNADDKGNSSRVVEIWDTTTKTYKAVDSVKEGYWKFLKVYINGICVSATQYHGDGNISQSNDFSYIEIGSDNATVDLYGVRVYGKALYDKEIVNNFIADTQNPDEKLDIFKRNNVLNDDGTAIDAVKLNAKIPCMYITCESTSTYDGFKNDQHILPMNKANKLGYTVVYNCDNLDDEAKAKYPWSKSFVAFNVRMNVQGTSSQYYPRKNYKLIFKTNKKYTDYDTAITTKKPTYLFTDTTGTAYQNNMTPEEYIKYECTSEANVEKYSAKYKLRDYPTDLEGTSMENISSTPATDFCLKADFMESSSTHNTGLAKFVDYIYKSLGRDFLTPPQMAQYDTSKRSGDNKMIDVTMRTSVDGYPIAMFWRKRFTDQYEFLGKYNINIDKGAVNVFGFDNIDDNLTNPTTGQSFIPFNEDFYDSANLSDRKSYEPPIECWEFTNNTTNLCKFKDVTDATFTEAAVEDPNKAAWMESFEARFPDNDQLNNDFTDKSVIPLHWKNLCKWISSTDREGSINGKRIPTMWNDTYDNLVNDSGSVKEIKSLNAYFNDLNKDPLHYLAKDDAGNYRFDIDYILEPQIEVDQSNHEWGSNTSYDKFGYQVTFVKTGEDSSGNIEGNWVLGEKYIQPTTAVDPKKCYYIALESDVNYGKCYQHKDGVWTEYANIEDFRLETPVKYGDKTYNYETTEYRLAKFTYELSKHMKVDFTIVYYIITEFFACVDQRAKNMMFASWGYEPGKGNIKAANAFANEEEALKAGYKPVYKYN